ncbi:MAG TPA: hypothetical protein PLO95_02440, partial [Spirochaetota bacterium]|nr:hypothetical protein [Spirochaetota bacterium]
IYRSDVSANGSAVAFIQIGTSVTNSYRDVVGYGNILEAGAKYQYKVMAKCGVTTGEPTLIDSGFSSIVQVEITTVPTVGSQLETATGITVTDIGITRYIRWNEVENASSYTVHKALTTLPGYILDSGNLGNYTQVGAAITNGNLVVTDNKVAGSYAYVVIASKSDNYLSRSNMSTAAVINVTADLTAPVISTAASNFSNKIEITWGKVSNATSYALYRSVSGANVYEAVTVTPVFLTNSNSYVAYDSSSVLEEGVTYSYQLVAMNTATNSVSAVSNTATGQLKTVPEADLAAPTGVNATDGTFADKVVITFEKVSGATSYEVYRADGNGGTNYLKLNITEFTTSQSKSNTIVCEDTTAVQGDTVTGNKVYSYKIIAVKTTSGVVTRSVASAADTGYVLPNVVVVSNKIKAPEGVAIEAQDGTSITVQWSEVFADATGDVAATSYDVYRSVTSATTGFVKIASNQTIRSTVDTAKFAYKDNDAALKKGYFYYYKIVSVNSTKNIISEFSGAATGFITGMDPVTGFTASQVSNNNAKIQFVWNSLDSVVKTGAAYSIRWILGNALPPDPLTGGTEIGSYNYEKLSAYENNPLASTQEGTFWIISTGINGQKAASSPVTFTRP